jgi:hypothetical protein
MRWVSLVLFALSACGTSGGPRTFSQQTVLASSVPGIDVAKPAVRELPVIARIQGATTEIVLRGRVTRRRAREIAQTARATVSDVDRRFLAARRATGRERPVDVCVFERKRDYDRFVHAVFGRDAFFTMGFYLPSHRLVVADLSKGLGNLRHELVHPLLRDAFPDLPDWLNEGVASLYGTARLHRGRYRFGVSHRLRHLRGALRRGTAPGLVELAVSGYEDVHGPRERAYYAMARYLLLYLSVRGQLETFFRDMTTGSFAPEHQLAVLRRYLHPPTFQRWVSRLR